MDPAIKNLKYLLSNVMPGTVQIQRWMEHTAMPGLQSRYEEAIINK